MDRNENGLPRTDRAVGNRDCVGNIRNPGGCNGNMNGSASGFGCGPQSENGTCTDCLDTKPLAYSYTPVQRWQMLYQIDKALERGTLFEELDKPSGVYGNE